MPHATDFLDEIIAERANAYIAARKLAVTALACAHSPNPDNRARLLAVSEATLEAFDRLEDSERVLLGLPDSNP